MPSNPPEPTPNEGHLERLQRELYARDTSDELAARSDDVSRLGIRREELPKTAKDDPAMTFVDTRDAAAKRRRRLFLISGVIAGLGILLAAGVGATIWYRLRQNVTAEQVALKVAAPAEVRAGDELTYVVEYGNASNVTWENVEVLFEFPAGFTVAKTEPALDVSGTTIRRTVGSLPSGESASFQVTGRLLGAENASVIGRAEIQLTPENFPSGRFTHTALLSTTILAAPLDVAVAAPQAAAVDERVAVTVTVTNKSEAAVEGAYVQLNPAVGMKLTTEDPEFSADYDVADRRWELPALASLETVTRTVILSVEGQPSEQRALDVAVGLTKGSERFVQQRASAVLSISSAVLTVDQTYQAAVSPLVVQAGENIQGIIRYTNAGTAGLKNLVVRAQVVGDSFDPASLKLPSGAYDPIARTIAWTSSTVPELALVQPQQGGEIKYEFSIKPTDQLPAQVASKNSTVVITALVDSPDVAVPVGQERKPAQDQFVMSVASDITLSADAFYDDGRLGITSNGPTPPEVGQETTYSIRLRLGSTLNDVGDVRLIAVLPDGVRYTGQKVATVGTVEFEERTGELRWSVPQIAGLQGRALPSADLYFQVAITPGENQEREIITFLNRLVVTGMDLFVDQTLKTELTTFPTTESAVPGKGRVE
jgi:uncharacterized repeat protein (TIGR01451 family)